jgi:hypothetical protein
MIISSSSPQQTSWESKRYANGVFTRKLIDSLEISGDKTTVSEAFKKLQDSVAQEVQFDRVSQQTPMMLSKWNGEDLALSAPPAEPREVLPEVKAEEMIYSTPSRTVAAKTNMTPRQQHAPFSVPKVSAVRQQGASFLPTPMMWTSWDKNEGDVTLESGTRRVTESELSALNKSQLLLLYNEGYARHGRGFVSKEIQEYFQSQPWYHIDPDYHWRLDDPRVIAHKSPDDTLIVNPKRTPKQWENMETIKNVMAEQK